MGKPGAERVCEMSGGVEEGHWQIQGDDWQESPL